MAISPIAVALMNGLYCYIAEELIDREVHIRDSYYNLNWFEAPLKSQKLILLAMQQPMEIKFGGIFSYDHLSLKRFSILIVHIISDSLF